MNDLRNRSVAASLVWTGEKFESNVAVHVDASGTIQRLAPGHGDVTLDRHALLPGFVNAHSHAFQRGLRATPQIFDRGSGNFWSWRETMYRLADQLDAQGVYEQSLRAFQEMLAAGITTVGEFHYLHHPSHEGTTDAWAFDDAVISAARDAGIRMVLIQCFYSTGSIGNELDGAQRRFRPISRDEFMKQCARLGSKIDPATQSLAIACHSMRAVAIDDLKFIHAHARANSLPFHMHVEEVRGEIEDCLRAHSRRPLELILDAIPVDSKVTAVHCTHSLPVDLSEFVARGASVCLCPITEGNLSDGFCDLPYLRSIGANIGVGTDCNIRLSATEELRWMEFAQRLRREARGIVVDANHRTAPALYRIGTVNGAASLGVSTGVIAPGKFADIVAVDLDHPLLRGTAEDALLDALILGCGNEPFTHTYVDGQLRYVQRS
jgi:formimidoylglutamate deiminase